MAINLSPLQFRDSAIELHVISALAESGLSPKRLELEITETAMIADTAGVIEILERLRQFGVRIALDDFGTGYASLSYLRQLPLDKLKIDRSFVRDIGKTRDCAAILKAIIGLARDLELRVTAEGVETREQLEFLHSHACDEIQGYLVSRPERADGVLRRLRQEAIGEAAAA